MVAKWLVIARNEYRVHTSASSPRLRKLRPLLPYLAAFLLVIHLAYVSPAIIGFFVDDTTSFFLSRAALSTIQIVLLMIFFYLFVIPVTDTLRGSGIEQIETYLGAPLKPGDVLLGEYLGQVPLYAVLITLLAGLFTAVLAPLGLDFIQITLVVAIFVIISLSALWIGTVTAALLRTRLAKASRGKDIGKAIAVMIPLPALAVTYAMIGGGLLEAQADPSTSSTVGAVLGLLPSSWGAKIIIGFAASPGEIGALGMEGAIRFGGLVLFFAGVLLIGSRLAGRAISLEPAGFSPPVAKPGGRFYSLLRSLGGRGQSGTILVSVFKDYIRRLENLTNIAYVLGLFVVINVFLVSESYRPDGPPAHLIVILIYLPVLVAMVTGDEEIWRRRDHRIYRQTPSGVDKYIRAMLAKGWFMAVPIAMVVTATTSALRPGTTPVTVIVITFLVMLICLAYCPLILGIYLLNPTLKEKFAKIWMNAMFVAFGSLGFFLASIQITMGNLSVMGLEQTGRLPSMLLVQASATWLAALIFLYLGRMKLTRSD